MPILKKQYTPKKMVFTASLNLAENLPEKLEKNMEYHCLSVGQYNLIDVVQHIVNAIGTCNIDLAVWTAANASLKKAFDFVKDSRVKRMRWIIDPSFESRQPEYVKTLHSLFGSGCIRTIPTHAKFIILYNEDYKVIIQTSMNLNQNKRLESFTIIENDDLCLFYNEFTDNIFGVVSQNNNFKNQNTAILKTLISQNQTNKNPDMEDIDWKEQKLILF